jgi:hypothetical protein
MRSAPRPRLLVLVPPGSGPGWSARVPPQVANTLAPLVSRTRSPAPARSPTDLISIVDRGSKGSGDPVPLRVAIF